MVPQDFSSARACSRFAAEGSLLPGVGRCAWIAGGELFVVGLERWGGGARRQQAGFPKAEAELRALEKRHGTSALLECESLLSLCGGGKLASRGGALGVDRGDGGFLNGGLIRGGPWQGPFRGGFLWLGLNAGAVACDARPHAIKPGTLRRSRAVRRRRCIRQRIPKPRKHASCPRRSAGYRLRESRDK